MSQIIDISLPIREGMPVYPGTAETRIETVASPTSTSVLSVLTLTSHAGTHIDAPIHSVPGSDGIDGYKLGTFYGPCRVLDVRSIQGQVSKADIVKFDVQAGDRILLKTSNSERGFDSFYDDYVFLGSDAAEYFVELGVVLVGIDSLSIKQRGSPDQTPHTALLSNGIAIIEGLDLSKPTEEKYILSALPLSVGAIDGSPIRAVLIKES